MFMCVTYRHFLSLVSRQKNDSSSYYSVIWDLPLEIRRPSKKASSAINYLGKCVFDAGIHLHVYGCVHGVFESSHNVLPSEVINLFCLDVNHVIPLPLMIKHVSLILSDSIYFLSFFFFLFLCLYLADRL